MGTRLGTKSESRKFAILFLIIASIFLAPTIGLGIWAFKGPYVDLATLILSSLFCVFSVLSIWCLRYYRTYRISTDRITVHAALGYRINTIFLKEINSWREKSDLGGKPLKLTIQTQRSKIAIVGLDRDEYEAITDIVTQYIPTGLHDVIDTGAKQTRLNKRIVVGMSAMAIGIGCVFILGGVKSIFFPEKLSLVEFACTAASTPDVHRGKGAFIGIKAREFPEFEFHIYLGYSATNKSLEYRINAGDSIFLTIDKDEYEKKVTKEKELSFSDKHSGYRIIELNGICDTANCYLSPSEYDGPTNGSFFFIPVGLVFIAFILYRLKKDWSTL
ncbi:MAG: hypothetical protein V4649_18035 [Bacteroidota bacterium]